MLNKQAVKALIQGGQWEGAKLACAELCKSIPKDAEAWFLLGAIHGQLENFGEAEKCCRRVIALNPAAPVIHFNLGITLQKQRKFDDAAGSFRQAIRLNPNYAEAHNELGVALQFSGNSLDKVAECYRQAVVLNPAYAEAHYNLAKVLRSMALIDEPLAHFREAVRFRPGLIKAHGELGLLLTDIGSFDQAVATYQEAFRHHPDNPDLHYQFGMLLMTMGRNQAARDSFRRVLELVPGSARAHAGMAKVLERQGDFEGGYDLLRPFLEEGKTDTDVVLTFVALAGHLGRQGQARELLECSLTGRMPVEIRKAIHFSLGKLYDEAKDYERAFTHYRNANDLVQEKFDLKKNERMFAELKSVFSAENTIRRPRATNQSRLPIFVVGMPRSGTSLVEQILASHPDVHGAGELIDMDQLIARLPASLGGKLSYPACMDGMHAGIVDQIAERHLVKLAQFSPQSSRVTDKMPHNFMALGLIDLLFPGARVIHCLRDPVDTCLSIYSLPFSAIHSYAADLARLGAYYLQYQSLMAHWKRVLRIPMLEVQYEEIVANQEEMSRKMIDFCELEWNDSCLRFYESKRVVTTPSYDQVRRPIYTKSVARWKNYEKHLGPLIAALGMDVDSSQDE